MKRFVILAETSVRIALNEIDEHLKTKTVSVHQDDRVSFDASSATAGVHTHLRVPIGSLAGRRVALRHPRLTLSSGVSITEKSATDTPSAIRYRNQAKIEARMPSFSAGTKSCTAPRSHASWKRRQLRMESHKRMNPHMHTLTVALKNQVAADSRIDLT